MHTAQIFADIYSLCGVIFFQRGGCSGPKKSLGKYTDFITMPARFLSQSAAGSGARTRQKVSKNKRSVGPAEGYLLRGRVFFSLMRRMMPAPRSSRPLLRFAGKRPESFAQAVAHFQKISINIIFSPKMNNFIPPFPVPRQR